MIFFNIILSIFIFLSSESTLVFVWFIKAQFFQLTLYKFIILGFLDLSPSTFWVSDSNLVPTIFIIIIY